MSGARLLRTAAGAALGAMINEMAERGAEALVGDLFFGVVMVGATTAGAVAAASRRAKDARIYTDKEGGWVTVRQATVLRDEFGFLRDPPAVPTFDRSRVTADNVHIFCTAERDPRDWTFVHKGWSEIDSAMKPGEIASRAVRDMVLDSYLRAANVDEIHVDQIERYVPGIGTCRYDRAMRKAANDMAYVATMVNGRKAA